MPLFSAKSKTPKRRPAKRKTLNCWRLMDGRLHCGRFSTAAFTAEITVTPAHLGHVGQHDALALGALFLDAQSGR